MKKNLLVPLLLLLLLTGCAEINAKSAVNLLTPEFLPLAPGITPTSDPSQAELTIAAAADLQFAFTELARLFEEQTGHKVTLVFGSTGMLAQQIENGAPYDLFAAANIDYIHQLADKKLVLEESVALYARGRIVLAVNRQAGIQAGDLKDLLDPQIRHIAIANPEHAPYGVAARQALEAAGVWKAIEPKLVLGENIRQVLQYIQTGDAEAGILALSVADVPEITWTLIDDGLHQPLDQALAIVASSPQPVIADQFIRFITSRSGRPVMRRYGFVLPDETPSMQTESAP